MPTCPNCGSYIPLGDHSCCCGTTIRYDVEDDDEERRYDEAVEYRRRRQRYLERIQNENPYDEDFFNELHHRDVSVMLIKNMNDQLSDLKNRFNASLDHVDVAGYLAIFTLKVQEEYFDATFKASYDMSSAFNRLNLLEELVIHDFTRLYSNEEFKNLIRKTESKTGHKFRFCKVLIIDNTLMVSAYFDNGGVYTIDLDNMSLVV